VRPVEIDDALKAEHCVEFERDMQLCACANDGVEVRETRRAVHLVALCHLCLDPPGHSTSHDHCPIGHA